MTSDKPSKVNIHNFLESINRDLGDFINNRIQDGILNDKVWSNLFEDPEEEWCWESMSCNKKDCPVRKQNNYRCWLIAGTLCGGMVQGVFAEKFSNCISCKVYKTYHEKPIRALYENISILISYLSDEAYTLHNKARIDTLTRLLNRASFDEIIDQEVKRSKRIGGIHLTLVEFDLDHFKEINDEGGHLTGDYYLVEFSNILRNVSRETDFVFRTGGDEFTVLMVDSKEEEMAHYIERIQNAIDEWNANEDRPHPYKLAASAGGACLNDFRYNLDKCITRADLRMYQNKQERKAGR